MLAYDVIRCRKQRFCGASIEVLVIVIVIVTSKCLNRHFNAKRRSPDDSGALRRVRKVDQSYRIVQLQRMKQSRCKGAREKLVVSTLSTFTCLRWISLDI